MRPDERTFRQHIETGRFLIGVADGRWRLVALEWPYALIAVSAAERQDAPAEFFIRLELTNYPQQAPQGQLWDAAADAVAPADGRPKGHRAERAFRADWQGLYIPCDRTTMPGHPDWQQQFSQWMWSSDADVTLYLQLIHHLLNAEDYTGV